MNISIVQSVEELARTVTVADLATTIHRWMLPYADTVADCRQGILDALQDRPVPGGFIITATDSRQLHGVLVMLRTGMSGYIPPNLLLFLAVDPLKRRCGIGTMLVQTALQETCGSVKLHVEAGNPAKILYDKLGFTASYIDMRFLKTGKKNE